MNTPTEDPRDDEFDAALRARRRFVPRFDDGHDDAEPSSELDRIVLARAREALRPAAAAASATTATTTRDNPERFHRGPRWAVPLALVATVLLSFTLLLQLDPARNDTVLAPRADAPAASVLAEQDVGASAMSAPAGPATPAQERAAANDATSAPSLTDGQATTRSATTARARVDDTPAAAPPLFAQSPEPLPAPAPAASVPTASGQAAPPPAAPPPPAVATARQGDSADAATPSEVAGYAASRDAAAESESRLRAAERREAAPLRDALQQASNPRAAKAAAGADEDPQAWLERIERLRQAGDLDAARTQLAEFRRRHPDVELPPALRDLR